MISKNILILTVALFGMSFFLSSCENFPEPSPRNYELFVGARDQYPKFSPDGEKMAYYHYSDQLPEPVAYPSGLYIMDRDGSNRQLVLEGHHFNPAWSPDGEWLVFSSQGVIQKCKVNGDSLISIAGIGYFFPDYSPDGKNLVFDRMVTEEGSLMIIDSNFIGLPQVFLPNITTGRDVEYSPDGSSFIYMKGSREWPHWEIFLMDTTGFDLRLTNNNEDDLGPTWSPDGTQIAWSSNVHVHTMRADGSNQKFLAYGQYPSWSMHDKIVFSHANPDYSKEVLYTINADGSDKKQITF